MKKLILLLSVFAPLFLIAQDEWVDYNYREENFPKDKFYTGFASEKLEEEDKVSSLYQELETYTKSQISGTIVSIIEYQSELVRTEVNSEYKEEFLLNSKVNSQISLTGVTTKKYYHKRKKTAYTFSYISKEDVFDQFSVRLKLNLEKIQSNVKKLNSSNKNPDINILYETTTLLSQIEQDILAVTTVFGSKNKEVKSITDQYIKLTSEIQTIQNELFQVSFNNISDFSIFLSNSIIQQAGSIDEIIQLSYFEFEDSKTGSPFSKKLLDNLKNSLIKEYSIITTQNFIDEASKPELIIKGIYWEENDRIKVVINLNDLNGNTLASSIAYLEKEWFESTNTEYVPENLLANLERNKIMASSDFINSDLILEVWTNKGAENLIFTEGDRMKIYLRANKECYIRIVYHLSDGTKVLLMDNYFLNSNLLNKVFEIPYEFECSPPFGVEVLQVNAQSQTFQILDTEIIDDYEFINNSLDELINKNRAMIKIKSETSFHSEKQLIITTVPN